MKHERRVIIVDVSKCMGCHSCEMACAIEHSASKELEAAICEEVQPSSRVHVGAVGDAALPLQCRQCEDAPCMAVCPTEALSRADENSPIIIDHELCSGCKECIPACPFGIIRMDNAERIIIKCDQCFERVEGGGLPACVEACPTGALQFKSLDETTQEKHSAYLAQIEMITYMIDVEKCVGCTLCAKACPAKAISGEKKKPHEIDQSECIKCGVCHDTCRFDAIEVKCDGRREQVNQGHTEREAGS